MAHEDVAPSVVQRQLGHSNLGITSIYLPAIDNAEIIEAVTPAARHWCPPAPRSGSDDVCGDAARRTARAATAATRQAAAATGAVGASAAWWIASARSSW